VMSRPWQKAIGWTASLRGRALAGYKTDVHRPTQPVRRRDRGDRSGEMDVDLPPSAPHMSTAQRGDLDALPSLLRDDIEQIEAASKKIQGQSGGVDLQSQVKTVAIDTSGLVPRKKPVDPAILARKTPETNLLKELKTMINMRGAISVEQYMREVLNNPEYGYYSSQVQELGEGGDFTTAPEVSQMFGELIGVWCVDQWLRRDRRPFRLIELGPGHGSLMADALRATRAFSGFHEAIQGVHFVEVSKHFRKKQHAAMQRSLGEDLGGIDFSWHDQLDEVPVDVEVPSLFILQEFLDVLPVHHFHKTDLGWCEVLVDVDEEESEHHLRFVLSRGPTPASTVFVEGHPSYESFTPETEWIEASPESWSLVQRLTNIVSQTEGAALMVDYGSDGLPETGRSLRGLVNHKFCSALQQPGEVDVTVDVDFRALRDAFHEATRHQTKEDCKVAFHGPVWQRDFLAYMGIMPRFEALVKQASAEQAEKLEQGLLRLMDTEKGMGKTYQAACIVPLKFGHPAGFPEG